VRKNTKKGQKKQIMKKKRGKNEKRKNKEINIERKKRKVERKSTSLGSKQRCKPFLYFVNVDVCVAVLTNFCEFEECVKDRSFNRRTDGPTER